MLQPALQNTLFYDRARLDKLPFAAVVLDSKGTLIYANSLFIAFAERGIEVVSMLHNLSQHAQATGRPAMSSLMLDRSEHERYVVHMFPLHAMLWGNDTIGYCITPHPHQSSVTEPLPPLDAGELYPSVGSIERLLEYLPVVIYQCLYDELWTFEYVNRAVFDLTGYLPEDMLQNRRVAFGDLIHPDDREMVRLNVRNAIHTKSAFRISYRMMNAMGTLKWVWEQGNALYDDAGNIVAISGVIIDVTRTRRDVAYQQLQLKVSQELLDTYDYQETLATTLRIVGEELNWKACEIWLLDHTQQRLVLHCSWCHPELVNSEFMAQTPEVTLGYGEGLPGRVWASISPAFITDVTADPLFVRSSTAQQIGLQGAIGIPLGRGGDFRGVLTLFSSQPPPTDNDLVDVLIDIAARLHLFITRWQAEDVTYRSNARANGLVRFARELNAQLDINRVVSLVAEYVAEEMQTDYVLVWLYDDATNEMRVHYGYGVSPEWLATLEPVPLNYYEQSMTNRGHLHIVADVQRQPTPYHAEQLCALGVRTLLMATLVREQQIIGFIETASLHQLRVFTSDDLLAMHGLVNQAAQAITNARLFAAVRAEQAQLADRVAERTAELSLANAELARTSRIKDEFLANVSHELRSPLNAILGMADALHEESFGELNEHQQRYVRIIRESGHHLLAVINDILDIARIEAGKTTLAPAPLMVGEVCHASLRMVQQTALKRQVRLFANLPIGNVRFFADERRLKQILVNLLDNAVKFTPPGGSAGLDVTVDDLNQSIRLAVWDNGIGIAEGDLPLLFRPFVRGSGGVDRETEGTGLGLTLVLRLVELHHGSIHVESTIGNGSRFTVVLPLAPNDSAAHVTVIPDMAVGTTVLLADDAPTFFEPLLQRLREAGCTVLVASSTDEVVRLFHDAHTSATICVLDAHLPGVAMPHLLTYIRGLPHMAQQPVLVTSTVVMPGSEATLRAAGATAVLPKPLTLNRMLSLLHHYMQA